MSARNMKKGLSSLCPLAVLAVAGCIAAPHDRTSAGVSPAIPAVPAELREPETATDLIEMPAGGWTWEALAVRAGERARRAGTGALKALVAQLETAEKTAWKEPELRYSRHWGDTSGSLYDHGSSSGRTRFDDGDARTSGLGVRFYVPNPFVNRYLRREGDAKAAGCEAKADVEAYAVYTEVKMMCLEAYTVARQRARRLEADVLLSRGKALAEAGEKDGGSMSPSDAIRIRTGYERNRLRLAATERQLHRLHSLIAQAAGVASEGFVLNHQGFALPDPSALSADVLVKAAFARRPDLAQAMAELEAADAAVGLSKAAMIPWFRFVEAGYRHKHGDEDSFESGVLDRESSSSSHEQYVEAALTIPLFSWIGDRVELSRKVREAADARVQALYASIRSEVTAALARYREARAGVDADGVERFVTEMTHRIEESEDSGAVIALASIKARMELNDYLELFEEVESLAGEASLALESVVGGTLPEETPREEKPAEPERTSGAAEDSLLLAL